MEVESWMSGLLDGRMHRRKNRWISQQRDTFSPSSRLMSSLLLSWIYLPDPQRSWGNSPVSQTRFRTSTPQNTFGNSSRDDVKTHSREEDEAKSMTDYGVYRVVGRGCEWDIIYSHSDMFQQGMKRPGRKSHCLSLQDQGEPEMGQELRSALSDPVSQGCCERSIK